MIAPGAALSADCLCSVPLTTTILLAFSSTFTSASNDIESANTNREIPADLVNLILSIWFFLFPEKIH